MDWSSASEAERVCDCGDGVQWPNDRNPIFFMFQPTRCRRTEFRACRPSCRAGSVLTVTAPGTLETALADAIGDVRARATDRLAYAHDASHYLLTPQAVAVPRDAAEVGRLLRHVAGGPGCR